MPLTVGGGVRTVEDIRELLLGGADKVSINTAAVNDPDFVARAADKFGDQCIVRSTPGGAHVAGRRHPRWEIFTHGGRNPTGLDAIAFAVRSVELGAGELLVTSMDRDGTKAGFDLELTRAIADACTCRSSPRRRRHARASGRRRDAGPCQRRARASIFHFGTFTVREAKERMHEAGIAVRMD